MKRIGKKLRLESETIAVLQDANLDQVNGGFAYTGCDSACTQCGGGTGRPTRMPNPIERPPTGGLTDGLTGQLTGGGRQLGTFGR